MDAYIMDILGRGYRLIVWVEIDVCDLENKRARESEAMIAELPEIILVRFFSSKAPMVLSRRPIAKIASKHSIRP
eukprot:1981025-Pleurochrysis_carterae.AAC.1